ncbi:hypothetical protein JYU34_010465 [Plutella xylostella]|uniref:Uncharacterized protein n=1 Tax=Plutella xylostella TaxID=51655 RepID=A0ABQ7QIL3_PLUXY|nr:uncharacterized protein LOC119694362 [Plutella xylostella]KAG7305019.1 hypothetical protein JYU34_010465 [Plutella xylostella]
MCGVHCYFTLWKVISFVCFLNCVTDVYANNFTDHEYIENKDEPDETRRSLDADRFYDHKGRSRPRKINLADAVHNIPYPSINDFVYYRLSNKLLSTKTNAVLITSYKMSMSIVYLARSFAFRPYRPVSISPMRARFYTQAFRWMLRHVSLWPEWILNSKTYGGTHHVWLRRHSFSDKKIPDFVQKLLFFVPQQEWEDEALEEKLLIPQSHLFLKYSPTAG